MQLRSQISPPAELTKHVTEILGENGRQWLSKLPELVRRLEKKWSIEVAEPFAAGEFNFVAPAYRNKSEPVVLKIAPPYIDGEFYSETAYLRHRKGDGCVRLLEEDRAEKAILLERALPGRNLTEEFASREPEAVMPAIQVLRSIQAASPPDEIDVIYLDRWFAGLERYISTDFPAKYAKKALDLYQRLTVERPQAYLHGDFHPANIVTATRAPYLVIDPKGIIGHIGYDIAVFLNNFHWWQETRADIRERLDRAVLQFSTAFDISPMELRQWAYAQMVLGAWWMFDEIPGLYNNEVAKADIWDV